MLYYSEQLKQTFETVEELQKAEDAAKEAAAKKAAHTQEKKEDAAKVEEAFKARNQARKDYNVKVLELRKTWQEEIDVAHKKYLDNINAAAAEKDKAEEAYNQALKDFTKKYDSFHISLKDGDNVLTLSHAATAPQEVAARKAKEASSFIDKMIDYILSDLRR